MEQQADFEKEDLVLGKGSRVEGINVELKL